MATAYEYDVPVPEWEELKIARLTYPQLTLSDQGTWLGLESVNYQSGLLQGYFTFRLVSNKFGPSLDEHIAKGHSHVLASMKVGETIRGGRTMEKILMLFLVDVRKASMRRELATLKRNKQNEEYLLFDCMTRGVDLFAERLRII
jgi:hypothetical protein